MPRNGKQEAIPGAALEKYRAKRDFGKTPEPAQGQLSGDGASFVIQEHHARSHHFDFRLEVDGVLVSWAVPKGMPEDSDEKRLAVHVENHPLEYGTFEGTIPKGNYGAGKVTIWDRGKWKALKGSAGGFLEKGKLTFQLEGERARGTYLLARMGEEPNWLLRRLGELPAGGSNGRGEREPAAFVEPQLARSVAAVPEGNDWLHEIKFDGYRLVAVRRKTEVTLHTRNGNDWTTRFPELAVAIATLSDKDFVMDGEAVVFDAKGRSSFGDLQRELKAGGKGRVVFVAFDLLHFDGENLRNLPLTTRLGRLERLVAEDGDPVRRSTVWASQIGPELFRQSCRHGLEGIVSKKADGFYRPGTRRDWVKSKCRTRQEFVICGFTAPKGSLEGFGALLLASFENGKLVPRGKVGTGFTDKDRRALRKTFVAYETKASAFRIDEASVTWLRPELVAEIEFAEITRDGAIRQGSFVGLREDKRALEVRLEAASALGSKGREAEVLGIRISHPDRQVYPQDGISKLEIARYYERVGDAMLPYVADHPLAVLRAPTGIEGELFFQKSFTTHVPPNVKTTRLDDGTDVFYVGNTKGLVSLAQFGAIEFHPWGARIDDPEKPDFVTWDLDPDSAVSWKEVLGAGVLLREILGTLGLEPMLKTSGGKGLHLVVRVRRTHTWDVLRKFTRDVSNVLAAASPKQFTTKAAKAARKGRIFIDWMRTGKGATCVAPWCLRARPGGKVSMPVPWEEVSRIPPEGFAIHEPMITPPEWRNPPAQSITSAMLSRAGKMDFTPVAKQ